MANVKYGIGRPFTTTSGLEGDFERMTGTSGPVATGYLTDNVRNEHIERVWRSTTGGPTKTLTVNIANSINPDAILIENTNLKTITVGVGAGLTAYTLTQNPRTGRYGRLIEPTQTGTAWIFRAAITGDLVDASDNYAEIGRICFLKRATTLTDPGLHNMQNTATQSRPWWQPYDWSPNALGSSRILAGGITETTSTSQVFLEFGMQGSFDMLDDTEISHPLAYTRMLTDQRVLHWEDRTEDTNNMHAYLCRRDGTPSISNEFPYLDIDMNLVEVI